MGKALGLFGLVVATGAGVGYAGQTLIEPSPHHALPIASSEQEIGVHLNGNGSTGEASKGNASWGQTSEQGDVVDARLTERELRTETSKEPAQGPRGYDLSEFAADPVEQALDLADLELTDRAGANPAAPVDDPLGVDRFVGPKAKRETKSLVSQASSQPAASKAQEAALREEVAMLRNVRAALRSDPERAEQVLLLYDRRFPGGVLRAEYEALKAQLVSEAAHP